MMAINIEYDDELEKKEEKQFEEDDSNELPPSDIVAYNELRSCADIVRMYKSKQLIIQPDFQRDIVWSQPSKTRFIDSLVKQLPIPSMCISLDYKTQERLVIDGLQRINSIIDFLSDDEWRLSNLDDIDSKIAGKTNIFLKEKNPEIYDRIENLTIPITVLRCDYKKLQHKNYLFTIFHRLNTGGNKLNNQEIRNCIYYGKFNDALKELVKTNGFVNLFDIDSAKIYRFANEELVLRFIAFSKTFEEYNGKLAKYLNDYMGEQKSINEQDLQVIKERFNSVISLIYNKITLGRALPKLSKATLEALYVGVSRNLSSLESKTEVEVQEMYRNLRNDDNFSVDNLKEGLSRKDKVLARLTRAVTIFSGD